MKDETVEDPAQRHLRRSQRLRLRDLTGHRSPQCGDALHELACGVSDLELPFDRLTDFDAADFGGDGVVVELLRKNAELYIAVS